MILTLWLLACTDPQLAPLAKAAAASDEGILAFEKGDFATAEAAFARARALDPNSPALVLWQARSVAATGRFPEAEALVSEVLAENPKSGLAWYNRASYRSRQGHHAAAADDLRRALALGASSALQAAIDPDFAGVLQNPAYVGILPTAPVLVATKGPVGSVFVGSELELELSVASAPGLHFSVNRRGEDAGCVVLRSIVEERRVGIDAEVRVLRLRLRAVAPCDTELGPFKVVVTAPAKTVVEAPSVAVRVEAPTSFVGAAVAPLSTTIFVPFEFAPTADEWSVGRAGERVFALGRPDIKPLAGGLSPDVDLELREESSTRAAGGYWISGPTEVVAGDFRRSVP